ncbi:MAG: NfeD family protein [Flavobacteriales bacterium]|nr:NfeD family protein [Flavobacteriales bacterium]
MTLTTILILLLLGLGLVILELLVVPGTTAVGVIGGLMLIAGIWFTYNKYGSTTGHMVLGGALIVITVMFRLALRAKTWKRLSVQEEITGKMNVLEEGEVNAGDSGNAVSRLAPMGKARINGQLYEVQSKDGWVDAGMNIRVVKVDGSKIIVTSV